MFNDILKLISENKDRKSFAERMKEQGIDFKSYEDYNDTDIYEYKIEKEEETEPKYRSMKNTKPTDMQNVVEGKNVYSNNFSMVQTKVWYKQKCS